MIRLVVLLYGCEVYKHPLENQLIRLSEQKVVAPFKWLFPVVFKAAQPYHVNRFELQIRPLLFYGLEALVEVEAVSFLLLNLEYDSLSVKHRRKLSYEFAEFLSHNLFVTLL